MSDPQLSLAFDAVANLCMAAGQHPLNKHEGCWEHQVDERWWIAVNGHAQPRVMAKNPKAEPLQPFHCFIEYNGWPAGLMTPYGGVIAAGECANEETFIAAVKDATEKLKGVVHER